MAVPVAEIGRNPADVDWNKDDPLEGVDCALKLSVGFDGLNTKPPFADDELTELVVFDDTAPGLVNGGNIDLNSADTEADELLVTDDDTEGRVLNTAEEATSPVDEVTPPGGSNAVNVIG